MTKVLSAPLVLPQSFETIEETRYIGKYLLRPLEPGYGVTVGNALRRVLLSSIEGYAIYSLKIPGVLHEFSTIPGVIEDTIDIVLNLKQVALRPKASDAPARIFVEVRQKEVLTAGDLAHLAHSYDVANPDLVVMHLDPEAVVQMELGIARGRGYRLAEENKLLLKDSLDLHEIVLDTSFSPVIRVVPRVETILYRERADYEQLLLEIETKGNITPREALQEATRILLEHFSRFLAGEMSQAASARWYSTAADPAILQTLQTPIEELELGLTATAFNSLRNRGVTRLIDLVQLKPGDLEKHRGIGKETVERIQNILQKRGLSLGMDVSAYKALLS